MSQSDQILEHLKHRGALTAIEALNLGMGMRLAARIEGLRKDGHDIHTRMVEKNGKRFAEYFLAPQPYLINTEPSYDPKFSLL